MDFFLQEHEILEVEELCQYNVNIIVKIDIIYKLFI